MRDTVKLAPVGRVDRRNLSTKGKTTDVLSRENFYVIGINEEERKIKKFPGSDRFNSESVGSYPFVSGIRYYTKNEVRKTFAFNQDGYIYALASDGTATQKVGVFNKNAYPCWEIMRVSDTDILYFSEGVSTGMYSHDGNQGNEFVHETSVSLNFVGMVSWLDRLWGFEEDSEDLFFSKNLEPTNFTDSTDAGQITIAAKRGSKIQAIMVFNDVLYIFKEDLIARVLGRTPSEFQIDIVHDSFGIPARRGICQVESGIMLLGQDYEVYSFGGTKDSLKLISYGIALSGDFTKDLVPIINKDRMEQVCATYHNRLFRLSFVEVGEVQNNLEYIFNTTNETDGITRGNKVACYIHYDRHPDKGELITGKADIGYLMYQWRGLNWDNQAVGATMSIKTQTKFYGTGAARNVRVRRVWLNSGVLGARDIPIKTYMDARIASSDATSEDMATTGEYKSPTTLMRIASQSAITSRQIPRHANSKGQNFSFEINEDVADRDFEMTEFECELIGKNLKRSQKVGV